MADHSIIGFRGKTPSIDPTAFVAEGVRLIGNVTLGPGSSVWYNAVIRGDLAGVHVGAGANIQDNAVLHVGQERDCLIGEDVLVGHGAICHACTIGRGALIGMGAIILSGVQVGEEALVAAGALVKENTIIPPRTLWTGNPACQQRNLGPGILERMREGTRLYRHLAEEHASTRG